MECSEVHLIADLSATVWWSVTLSFRQSDINTQRILDFRLSLETLWEPCFKWITWKINCVKFVKLFIINRKLLKHPGSIIFNQHYSAKMTLLLWAKRENLPREIAKFCAKLCTVLQQYCNHHLLSLSLQPLDWSLQSSSTANCFILEIKKKKKKLLKPDKKNAISV